LGDLIRVYIVTFGQLSLEFRRVIPAGSSAHIFSPHDWAYHASIEQKTHLTGCSDFQDHLYLQTGRINIFEKV